MTPQDFTDDFMESLCQDNFFDNNLVSKRLLKQAVLRCSERCERHTGSALITEEDLGDCLQEATEMYIDEALLRFSEMGLLNILVSESGTMEYHKNICRARQLGYIN